MRAIIALSVCLVIAAFACVESATPITILWEAPYDLPDSVRCSGYSLRYAKSADSLDSHWLACRVVPNVPLPSMPGLTDSVKFSQLSGDSVWYAIKAVDAYSHWSIVSMKTPIYIPDNLPPNQVANLRFFLR